MTIWYISIAISLFGIIWGWFIARNPKTGVTTIGDFVIFSVVMLIPCANILLIGSMVGDQYKHIWSKEIQRKG